MAEVPAFLASVVYSRARILSPAVLGCLVFYTVALPWFGIDMSSAVYIVSWSLIGADCVVTAALVTRRIPVTRVQLASASTLWFPLAATAVALYATRNQAFALLFVVQIAAAGTLLDTRWVAGTLVAAAGVAMWLLFRTSPHAGMFASTIVVAGVFAMLIHVQMRRALARAETHRLAEAETNHKLAKQLTELAQSQSARAELQQQLLHAQRMEAVGTLAAGIAHDMNNVLASITSFASLLRDDGAESHDIQQILSQAERGASLTRGLLAFSRRGQYRKQVVQIGQIVRDVLPLLARTLPKSIEIRPQLALDDACVEADPVHLQQALVNFGLNAAEAMDGKGVLVISGDIVELDADAVGDLPAGSYVRLSATDTGKGMDAATRLRVFEPFFTTKPLGAGTGLGLSTVWGVVQAHGGAVDVESELGKGSTFRMFLPMTTREPSFDATQKGSQPILRKSTVLVVDDEAAVRESTKRLIERMGLHVITARNGEEALRVLAEHGDTIELVVLDMGMPVMGGAECFRKLRETNQVPVLIATGYAVEEEAQAMVAAGASLIEKPFPSADLKREVARLLDHGGVHTLAGRVRSR